MRNRMALIGLFALMAALVVIPAAIGVETGSISGMVTIAAVEVADLPVLVESGGESPFIGMTTTGSDGKYTVGGLPDGSYVVRFCSDDCGPNVDTDNRPLDEWFDNAHTPSGATLVAVVGGAAVIRIDADLTYGGSISGRTGDTHRGQPGAIEVFRLDGLIIAATNSETESGTWVVEHVVPGWYKVRFLDEDPRYVDENNWYSGRTDFDTADLVRVVDGQMTPNIDFFVDTTGTISGTVHGEDRGPLEGIRVGLVSHDDEILQTTLTGLDGGFLLEGIPAGVYYLLAVDPLKLFADTWYPDTTHPMPATTSVFMYGRDEVTARDIFMDVATAPAGFTDVGGSAFISDIAWLAAEGITKGCNPPANDRYCPDSSVTRGQMAAFLARALGLTERLGNPFVDDDESVFEADIERLAAAGITRSCNPPTNDRFCPEANVTRAQMAAFLVRALGYTSSGDGDLFRDDDGSIFEDDIDRLGTAGVTKGCNPPTNDRYCPKANVTRGQMAAFLHRALGN